MSIAEFRLLCCTGQHIQLRTYGAEFESRLVKWKTTQSCSFSFPFGLVSNQVLGENLKVINCGTCTKGLCSSVRCFPTKSSEPKVTERRANTKCTLTCALDFTNIEYFRNKIALRAYSYSNYLTEAVRKRLTRLHSSLNVQVMEEKRVVLESLGGKIHHVIGNVDADHLFYTWQQRHQEIASHIP